MNVTVTSACSHESDHKLPHSHDYHLHFLTRWTNLLQEVSEHNGHGAPCFPLHVGYTTPGDNR